jgi:hypothetical protein
MPPPRAPSRRSTAWKQLLDHLNYAIDQIYEACEDDENVLGCREVVMTLGTATNDFAALIQRIETQTAFERAEEGSRPLSLAWQVRKSPGIAPLVSWADRVSGRRRLASTSTAEHASASGPPTPTALQPLHVNWADEASDLCFQPGEDPENWLLSPLSGCPTPSRSHSRPLSRTESPVPRSPGSAVLLHEKLSDPSRKRSMEETARISSAKHERATQACMRKEGRREREKKGGGGERERERKRKKEEKGRLHTS